MPAARRYPVPISPQRRRRRPAPTTSTAKKWSRQLAAAAARGTTSDDSAAAAAVEAAVEQLSPPGKNERGRATAGIWLAGPSAASRGLTSGRPPSFLSVRSGFLFTWGARRSQSQRPAGSAMRTPRFVGASESRLRFEGVRLLARDVMNAGRKRDCATMFVASFKRNGGRRQALEGDVASEVLFLNDALEKPSPRRVYANVNQLERE